MKTLTEKIILAVIFLAIGAISFFLIAAWASSSDIHSDLISSLDKKIDTVQKLISSCATASISVSAIPGDTATPIAEKLTDVTVFFMGILSVLYTEKFMMTLVGLAAFRVLIPSACVAAGIYQFAHTPRIKALAVRMAVVGLALFIAVPNSINLSNVIYKKYESQLNQVLDESKDFSSKTTDLVENEDKGIIGTIMNKISETVSGLTKQAAKILNRYLEAVAAMFVTACVVPLAGLLFMLWFIKLILTLQIPIPESKSAHNPEKKQA